MACPVYATSRPARKRFLRFALLLLTLSAPADERAASWASVQSWVYQLTDYPQGRLDEITASEYDLAVIDLSRDGGSAFFTRDEIRAVKASGKFVLAYFSIGSIEEYRPEWPRTPKDLKHGAVRGWPRERYVAYWDERWWQVVRERINQALKAGFDGAYLDMVTAYEEIPDSGLGNEERARRMVRLIVRISEYAKSQDPDFRIVPQNAPELYTWSYWEPAPNLNYIHAIDGIGLESVFFLAHDKPANREWCEENRKNAQAIRKAGKLVFGVDYAANPANIAEASRKQRELGFIPYVTVEALDRIQPKHDPGND